MKLRVENCDLLLGGHQLLSGVSISASAGEVVSVIGANGAGKTSLLKLICGEYKPDRGKVWLDDTDLSTIDLDVKAKKLAVLPQRSMLDFPFLVEEVIEMGRYPQMTGRMVDEVIIKEVIDLTDLRELAERRYTTLSGGERQRVQIARVVAQLWEKCNDACYLFDEPTAPLDLAHQLEFFRMIKSIAARGAIVLLVIHDINLALRFSDRLILLRHGEVIADGEPADVVTETNIRIAFNVKIEVIKQDSKVVQISY